MKFAAVNQHKVNAVPTLNPSSRDRFLGAVTVAFLLLVTSASAIVPWTNNINTNNIIVVTNAAYGAVFDNSTDNALAISNAIVAAARGGNTNGLLGGTVEIPAGTNAYLCGPIT